MIFEFSNEERILLVHHVSVDGIYINSNEAVIQPGEGLPAQSTITDLVEYGEDEVLQLQADNTWLALSNYIGKKLYSKDGDESKDYTVEELGLIPDSHTLLVREAYHSWNEALEQWEYDEILYRPVLIEQEHQWQQAQLTKTSTAIAHYESDAKIPDIYSELRVTNYTEDDYYALLGDRKLLIEYLEQQDFPECGRPKLSGLVPD